MSRVAAPSFSLTLSHPSSVRCRQQRFPQVRKLNSHRLEGRNAHGLVTSKRARQDPFRRVRGARPPANGPGDPRTTARTRRCVRRFAVCAFDREVRWRAKETSHTQSGASSNQAVTGRRGIRSRRHRRYPAPAHPRQVQLGFIEDKPASGTTPTLEMAHEIAGQAARGQRVSRRRPRRHEQLTVRYLANLFSGRARMSSYEAGFPRALAWPP